MLKREREREMIMNQDDSREYRLSPEPLPLPRPESQQMDQFLEPAEAAAEEERSVLRHSLSPAFSIHLHSFVSAQLCLLPFH